MTLTTTKKQSYHKIVRRNGGSSTFSNYVQVYTVSVGNPIGFRSLRTQTNSYTTDQYELLPKFSETIALQVL